MIPKDVVEISDLLVAELDISPDRAEDMAWVIYNAGFRKTVME